MTVFATLRAAAIAVAALACARAESKPANATAPAAAVAAGPSSPTDPIVVAADAGRTLGNANAKLWVVMISDFQCPYCKQWHDQSFDTIRREYVETGKIRLAFLNQPLSIHPNSRPAAEAAMCASAQGKFWPMHDALFAAQDRWAPLADAASVIDSVARVAGVDVARMRACVKSGVVRPLVEQDQKRANDAGARATPSFVIGQQLISGAVPVAELRAAIDAALAGSTGMAAPADH